MAYLSVALKNQLIEADNDHCAYCQTSKNNTGPPLTIDHIIPQAQGGETVFENLCFACRRCNEYKGDTVQLQDPLTGKIASLFHLRQQHWRDHFQWDETGAGLLGLTIIGRVTIIALNTNNSLIVDTRRRWVSVGWHPPQ